MASTAASGLLWLQHLPSLFHLPLPRHLDQARSAGAPGTRTNNNEDVPVDMGLDVNAASTLRVVSATEAGDVHHAALVDVHHAGCEAERGHGSVWPLPCLGQLQPCIAPTPLASR
jgi:hypothetical protein